MNKRVLVHAFVFATLFPLIASAADAALGKVVSLSGKVLIDAFGRDAFIDAIVGDALYGATIITTGPDGRVTVELSGRKQEIPPGAKVRVSDLAAAGAKKGALRWFQALGNLFKSLTETSRKKEEDVVLGSRAKEVGAEESAGGIEWEIEETDFSGILEASRKDIQARDYSAALEKLSKVGNPSDPSEEWEAHFWKGFCYFQLEDYIDAAASLSAAYGLMNTRKALQGTEEERRTLLFQLGASWFLLGREKESIPLFDAFLASDPGDEYEPYAYLFLAKALSSTGDSAKARAVAEQAAKKYGGGELSEEFAAFLK